MAKGKHPAPFRTRKLSPSAPMVLHAGACGRVGRRRTFFPKRAACEGGPLCCFPGPDSGLAPTMCFRRSTVDACRRRPFAWPPPPRAGVPGSRSSAVAAEPRRRAAAGSPSSAAAASRTSAVGGNRTAQWRQPAHERDRSKDRTRSTAGRWRRDDLPERRADGGPGRVRRPADPRRHHRQGARPARPGQLKSLPEKLAARVARHLVAAAQLMEADPETAYKHTLAARARASRVSVVREASGEAAYAAGKFKEALTEFKAARRMSDNGDVPPDDGRLRARSRPSRAGVGAGQGPAGRSSSTTTARSR